MVAFYAYLRYLADTYRAEVTLDIKACGMVLKTHYSNVLTYLGAYTNTICNKNSPTEGEEWDTIPYETLTGTGFWFGRCRSLSPA